jgi:hypothetical protein
MTVASLGGMHGGVCFSGNQVQFENEEFVERTKRQTALRIMRCIAFQLFHSDSKEVFLIAKLQHGVADSNFWNCVRQWQ